MITINETMKVAGIGIGATVVMDIWSLLMKSLGIPVLDYALVGRWVGHLSKGKLRHPGITKTARVQGESVLGWTVHYAVGIAIAILLTILVGTEWLHDPTLRPAVLVGTGTVVLPLFVMQPCMGAGFAASRTPSPLKNCLRSMLTHAVFGSGLYLSAVAIRLAGG